MLGGRRINGGNKKTKAKRFYSKGRDGAMYVAVYFTRKYPWRKQSLYL